MKVEVEKLAECKQRLEIEVPLEEVGRQFEVAYRELGRKYKLDGFRPGKVPLPVLKSRFGEVVAAEALKKIVVAGYSEAIKERNILPLGEPDIEVGKRLPEEKQNFSFQATVETWPEVKVEGYRGLTVEREKVEVRDEDIEEILQMKREENADFLPVEGRPVKGDDWVVLDFKSFLDGSPFQSAEGHLFRLGSGFFPPEVEERLIGKLPEADEEQEVEVSLSGDKSPAKILYRIKLRGIKECRFLIVDDEFARDLGEFNSLVELREDIRKKLEARAREEEEKSLRDKIVALLVERNEIELPSRLIEEQIDHLLLIARAEPGASDGGEEKRALREKLRPVAIGQVKASLLLEEIAGRENIAATGEEIDEEAKKGKGPLTKEGREDLAYRIRRRKTLDFLISQAEIKEKEKSLVLTPDQVRMLMPQEKKFRRPGGAKIIVP